jgi:biotin operon repressor
MNLPIQQRLIDRLRSGPASAAALAEAIGVSRNTIMRAIQPLERDGRLVRWGTTRGARYGLTRQVGSVGSSWPLYCISDQGQPEQVATVHAIERDRYFVTSHIERLRGSFEGPPHYLQDARPGGFLGRAIPTAHPELALPPRVVDWNDDHVLVYLTQRGSEITGNLILGTAALDRFLSGGHQPPLVAAIERRHQYPAMAAAAMRGSPPASSTHGEHPKFSARIARSDGGVAHALVKFSPPRTTAVGVRWADLLLAEHAAAVLLDEHGLTAAPSELHEFGDQVFLESQRFDRAGNAGRLGVASLLCVDAERYGRLDSWLAAAERLRADGLLSDDDTTRLAVLDTFGALIANSDRHFGNVTLFDDRRGPFRLAPVYDMLPMLFAPQDGHLVERVFTPVGPTAASLQAWPRARALAEEYWLRLSRDDRITVEFRAICSTALRSVRTLPATPAPPR